MADRKIPGQAYDNETRNKVLDIATELFALHGFCAVSMRDISKAVGIQISSIYYHYESKEALMDDVLLRFENGYRHYFDWLTDMNAQAKSLNEVMDNMFNAEFLEMQNPIGCLGMSLALKEQHSNTSARKRTFELFYEHSINLIQADFDRLIKNGIIPPSDTKTLATIFMCCVLIANDIRVHEYTGEKTPIDCAQIYDGLKKFMTLILAQGSLHTET